MSFESPQEQSIPNLGKIKMKSTDESGHREVDSWTHHRSSQATVECRGGLQEMGLLLLFDDGGILLERNSPVASGSPCSFGVKHSICEGRLYREGNVHVRAGDVTPELAPVEPAEESWTRMDDGDHDGDHDEHDQADRPEEAQESLSCSSALHSWREQEHFQTNHAVFAPCDVKCV